ncbi:recombinase family protein [Mycolicibacterium gilvum]|uniref:Resolvase n=1 Tax=Mycolicibacterium gilvum TaxID=1804 RepID=A0A378SGJ7_9MYCO|nr:resolvase [Mycolicibacterium gilvum]
MASGARARRPGLDELVAAVVAGDTVVVTRLDRLGRSLPHLLGLVENLAAAGVGLRSLAEEIDTSSATGRLVLHVFGALAEFERGINHERTMGGLAAARARGRIGGRPPALRGRRLAHARKLAAAGMPVAEIADTLLVGRSTVYRALNGSREQDGEEMTSSPIDRVWSVRDAVLKWLYLKAMVDGNRHPVLKADDIANAVEWQGDSLTQQEVAEASEWLRDQEYISGTASWGHGVVRPSITAKGEALADAGKSVRGGNAPADPQGATTIHISNSANVAIGSPGATQTYTVAEQIKRALAVADALEAAADGPPEAVEHAHQIAVEIKREAAEPQPNPSRLKQLLLYAITAGVGALGQTAATDLVHLASQALQTF